jgi:hypothetical protein
LTVVAMLLTACFESVPDQTSVVLKPLVQPTSGGLNEPLAAVRAYAFEADTTEWGVASWEDALDGVLTSKLTGEKLSTPFASSEAYTPEEGVVGMENRLVVNLPPREMMLLVVNEQNRLYAYNNIETAEGMASLYITLIFKPWKEMTAYREGWSFYNPFYAPNHELETYVDVAAQSEEGGPRAAISSVKVYAFAADSTEWRIASYDDAVGGTLTSKHDESVTRSNPEFNGYETNTKGTFRMKVSASPLMVVVVDRTHRMYAYSKQTVDLEATTSPTFSVLFRTWLSAWISEENGWRVVNPEYEPETEEQTPSENN